MTREQISDIAWIKYKKDRIGHFFVTIHGISDTIEYSYATQAEMRKMFDLICTKHGLITIAPDLAVNPHKLLGLSSSKDQTEVRMVDESMSFSVIPFAYEQQHSKILAMRFKAIMQVTGGAANWLYTSDAFQFMMVLRSAVKYVCLEHTITIFHLGRNSQPFNVCWGNRENAEAVSKYIQKQLMQTTENNLK
ncbi:hypothetical protein [Suttonella ornithocola]|uniref:Uncharacterized protein n=1 Tax=Suttonella ornithocola TaxID=279832 RepID=A0A380MUW7_9GAMM|nr:hypothetical protein [Suttonella ornithocola]SUO96380.1 Uncharacterised protein [Suttonella ornithocola]